MHRPDVIQTATAWRCRQVWNEEDKLTEKCEHRPEETDIGERSQEATTSDVMVTMT
jgi:hypothetical protein